MKPNTAVNDAGIAEVLGLLAIVSRETDKLYDLARRRNATVTDVHEASTDLIDTIYNLEIVLDQGSDELSDDEDEDEDAGNWGEEEEEE